MKKQLDTAVILAAGQGTRLEGFNQDRPKCFLNIHGKPLLYYSLKNLKKCGIKNLIFVVGYQSHIFEEYTALFNDFAKVDFVLNKEFHLTGSYYSLLTAGKKINQDFLLLESDILYDAVAITEILSSTKNDVTLTSGTTDSGDEVYVEVEDGYLTNLSKNKNELSGTIAGEWVGISKVSLEFMTCLCEKWSAEQYWNLLYEQGMMLALKEFPIGYHFVGDLVWGEIDNKFQYDRAVDKIFPKITF